MTDIKNRPVSPVNGQPLPRGKPFVTGDERARKAGKRSAQKRAERKTLREELLALLTVEITSKDGTKTGSTQEAISRAMIQKAMKGDVRAFEIIRDTIGEKPVDKVAVTTPAPDVISSVENALFGDEKL